MPSNHKLKFDFEWIDPAGARGEELRATWASLAIVVDGEPVTELHDLKSRSVRTNLFIPLYPLAEWLATNWWFLSAETERSGEANQEFCRRHNLRWAREGFALPSLQFITLGNHFEVQWTQMDFPDAGVKFIGSGKTLLTASDVNSAFTGVVDAVIRRLNDLGVQQTALHDEWAAIQSASDEEQCFCLASARMGVDPYSVDETTESAIVTAANKIRPELADDFFALTSATSIERDTITIYTETEYIQSDTDSVDALRDLRSLAAGIDENGNPWEKGYRFASQLRSRINQRTWKSQSIDDLTGILGVDQLDHCLVQGRDVLPGFDAIVGTNTRNVPKIIIKKSHPDSKQFAFCRALFEHLTCPLGQFSAVTKLRTERQQMSRAFAAEFLAPHSSLRHEVSGGLVYEDELEDLARDYGVSEYVIRHQLENHRIARVVI